jgi:hypothetical protein
MKPASVTLDVTDILRNECCSSNIVRNKLFCRNVASTLGLNLSLNQFTGSSSSGSSGSSSSSGNNDSSGYSNSSSGRGGSRNSKTITDHDIDKIDSYLATGNETDIEALWELASNFLPIEIKTWKRSKCHLYIDESNIRLRQKSDQNLLLALITAERTLSRSYIAGSSKFGERDYKWNYWKANNFEVQSLLPVRAKEQAVDDLLHAAMLDDISKSFPEERTILLLTGDGNDNNGRTSFPKVVEKALLNSWNVEVYSWAQQASQKYQLFEEAYPSQFSLNYLDDYTEFTTRPAFGRKANVCRKHKGAVPCSPGTDECVRRNEIFDQPSELSPTRRQRAASADVIALTPTVTPKVVIDLSAEDDDHADVVVASSGNQRILIGNGHFLDVEYELRRLQDEQALAAHIMLGHMKSTAGSTHLCHSYVATDEEESTENENYENKRKLGDAKHLERRKKSKTAGELVESDVGT